MTEGAPTGRPKRGVSDLARFGGAPLFREPVHVGHVDDGTRQRFFELAGEAFDQRRFTNDGPLLQRFEEQLRERLGAAHVIAVCNASIGLQMVVRAVGMGGPAGGSGGRVILPSFTFVATAHALHLQGVEPVFCDVDPATHNLDPACVEDALDDDVTGILGVHLWGRPCDVTALQALADRRGVPLVFDAAHAFAVGCGDRMVGRFGRAEVLSFHATKVLSTFEGGAIVTDDDALADELRLARSHGFRDYDHVVTVGTNAKLSEISAAMGLAGLEGLDAALETNRERHARYAGRLGDLPGVTLLPYPDTGRTNHHYVVCEIDPGRCGLDRDQLVALMHAEGVLARRYFAPGCHGMEPYRTLQPDAGRRLPVTGRLCREVLVLPTGRGVSAEQVDAVCDLLRFLVERAPEVARRGWGSGGASDATDDGSAAPAAGSG